MDDSVVGQFGTLRLMKRLEPDQVVASYPIDDEETTFGRESNCSIRLYYDSVSNLHCKLVFRERKAFLEVLGINGVLVDNCPVFPISGPSHQPATVPLPNNSTIEIHKKRFQFSYPPKEMRAAIINTPSQSGLSTPERRHRRRTLRMSMIHSAQVFTPGPSENGRENLRILQTPIKTPFSRAERRQSSPLKRGAYIPEEDEDEEEEEEIVLVETKHPSVYQEEQDLVILERVHVKEPEPQPEAQQVQFPIPEAVQQQLMQTPPRKRMHPRSSLHRAVLLRSAQRVRMQKEIEQEEEEEMDADEVEQSMMQVEEEPEEDEDEEEAGEEHDEQQEHIQSPGLFSGIRKSLGAVKGWAFRASPAPDDAHEDVVDKDGPDNDAGEYEEEEPEETPTPEPDEDGHVEYTMDAEPDADDEAENEEPVAPLPTTPSRRTIAPRRPLGNFMTPQVSRTTGTGPKGKGRLHARYSVGGFTPGGIRGVDAPPTGLGSSVSGPRRVRVVEPWKVADITVPIPDEEDEAPKEEENIPETVPSTPAASPFVSPTKRERITEEERKAILERRKSALVAPDFWGGQTPGSRRISMLPSFSPMKSPAKPTPITEDTSSSSNPFVTETNEEDEDTSVLLARMKQMVEGVKKRQSLGPRPSVGSGFAPTPRKPSGFSLLAPDADAAPVRTIVADAGDQDEDEVSDKENDDGIQQLSDVEMDHDVEEPAQPARRPPSTITPRMDDLRHVFRDPKPTTTPAFRGIREMFQRRALEAQTPQTDGVRHMFNRAEGVRVQASTVREIHQQDLSTPMFEGVGDMLAIPGPPGDATQEEQPQEEEPEEEPHQEEPEVEEPIPQPPKFTRARKPATMKSTPATRRTPRHATQEDAQPEEDSDSPAPPTTRVSRKPRSKAGESDAEPDEGSKTTTRRTRNRVTPSPAPEEPKATATRTSTRKTRGGTKTPTPEPPATRTGTARRTRARTPLPEVEEEDPLDTIPRPESPEVPLHEETGAKVRRSVRSKVKEEHEDDASPAVAPPVEKRATAPRAMRGRKPAGAPTGSGIPRGMSRGGRAGSTARVATSSSRSAKAAETAAGGKENTPEPDDEEPEPARPTAARSTGGRTAKVTRSVGRTRAASEQPEKPAADAARARVSRTRVMKK